MSYSLLVVRASHICPTHDPGSFISRQNTFPNDDRNVTLEREKKKTKGQSRIVIIFIYDNYYYRKRGRGSENDDDYHNFFLHEKSAIGLSETDRDHCFGHLLPI